MKTITKLSVLSILALGLAGCGDENEKNVTTDAAGKKTAQGQYAPGAKMDSKAAYEAMKTGQPKDSAAAVQGGAAANQGK